MTISICSSIISEAKMNDYLIISSSIQQINNRLVNASATLYVNENIISQSSLKYALTENKVENYYKF